MHCARALQLFPRSRRPLLLNSLSCHRLCGARLFSTAAAASTNKKSMSSYVPKVSDRVSIADASSDNGLATNVTAGAPASAPDGGAIADAVREAALLETNETWRSTLERVVRGVAAIRVSTARSFDTYSSGYSVATGFVVDRRRGILLSNAHVTKHAPVRSEAVFFDHEEVPLRALYRDPVHDFGFFRFDPAAVRFMELAEVELFPAGAAVGVEVRVVGNDAGEKLSILSGTIARLDRPAPNYGEHKHSDFNTFYIQAASSTSGGSSGSPVIDVSGRAVALNAGGRRGAATSYYLPLDRIASALRLLQEALPDEYCDELPPFATGDVDDLRSSELITSAVVPRGTLQAVFQHHPYDELRRLGLTDATEQRLRTNFPSETGMLVVDQVVAEGPGAKCGLEEGDILVEISGNPITSFIPLEAALDEAIAYAVKTGTKNKHFVGSIEFKVERGGSPMILHSEVGDLHEITPHEFLEVGQGTINMLGYHEAKNNRLPCGDAPYLSSTGFMMGGAGVSQYALIRSVNGHPTPNLADLVRVLAALNNRQRVPVKFVKMSDRFRERTGLMRFTTEWQRMRMWRRNDRTGYWTIEDVPFSRPLLQADESKTETSFVGNIWEAPDDPVPQMHASPLPLTGRTPVKGVEKSLVMVSFSIPYVVDGCYSDQFAGIGLIVDWGKGLVVVDRNTVPIGLGDCLVTLGGSTEIPASVVFLHPIHNFAVVQFDPQQIDNGGFESASLFGVTSESTGSADSEIQQGDDLFLFGMSSQQTLFVQRTTVSKIENVGVREARPARFRAINSEGIWLERHTSSIGGVLADDEGRVRALWANYASADRSDPLVPTSFFRGLPVDLILDVVEPLRRGERPIVYSLEVELKLVKLSAARVMGLADEWVQRLEATGRRMAMAVARTQAGTDAFDKLKGSDLILAVDDSPVTTARAIELAIKGKDSVELTLLRDTKELRQVVKIAKLNGREADRVVIWAGCMLQDTHRAVKQLGYEQKGVFIGRWYHGSPCHQYGLRASSWITHINEKEVDDLAALLIVVSELEEAASRASTPEQIRACSSVRLKVMAFQERSKVVTLKPDSHYWPTCVLSRDEDGDHWRLRTLQEYNAGL